MTTMHNTGVTETPSIPTPQATDGLATASLVLGILGFFTAVTAIPAVICGHIAHRRTRSGQALAGLVMGYIAIAFMTIGIVALVVVGSGAHRALQGAASNTNTVNTNVGVQPTAPAVNQPTQAPVDNTAANGACPVSVDPTLNAITQLTADQINAVVQQLEDMRGEGFRSANANCLNAVFAGGAGSDLSFIADGKTYPSSSFKLTGPVAAKLNSDGSYGIIFTGISSTGQSSTFATTLVNTGAWQFGDGLHLQ